MASLHLEAQLLGEEYLQWGLTEVQCHTTVQLPHKSNATPTSCTAYQSDDFVWVGCKVGKAGVRHELQEIEDEPAVAA